MSIGLKADFIIIEECYLLKLHLFSQKDLQSMKMPPGLVITKPFVPIELSSSSR
jgi:hypothetical protein